MTAADRLIYVNGLNATTGQPLLPALSPDDLVRLACGEPWEPEHLLDLKRHHRLISEDGLDTMFEIESRDLSQSGWGVVFAHGAAPELRQRLGPLLEHRRAQAGRDCAGLYRELDYRPGESKSKFLSRYRVGPGPVDPQQMPYYLLLVGGPDEIPFSFQYQLDVQYAVGRLHFADWAAYEVYARSVVDVEGGDIVSRDTSSIARRPRSVALFGVANDDDRATLRSVENLVEPLSQRLAERWGRDSGPGRQQSPWEISNVLRGDATKSALAELLGGASTPSLLFTASHGIGFDKEDPLQRTRQGSLLCQDWPGPRVWRRPIPAEHYFSARDIAGEADLQGLITFHFACYGAGTPLHDQFAHRIGKRHQIAPRAFVAGLPQRLLSHPQGAALAVVGHVDRAWSYSFDWPQAPRQLAVFESVLGRLLDGYPVGAAMEYFNQRYAELSSDLSLELENVKYGTPPDHLELPGMWTANNDARSYVVLGDPAVRLAVD